MSTTQQEPHIMRKAVSGNFFVGDLDAEKVNTEIEVCMMKHCAQLHSRLRSRIPRGKKHQYVNVTFRLIAEITPV